MDCGKTAKPGAGSRDWIEAGLLSGLGSSSSKVVNSSPFQTDRYFIIFPVVFSFCSLSLKAVINPSLALQHSMVKLSFCHTKMMQVKLRCSSQSIFMARTLKLEP